MAQDRRITDTSGEESTVIGKGIHIDGEISGTAPIEVWGSVEGKAGTRGLMWVREGGKVGGEIAATNVVVEGAVNGKIAAKEKLELRSTCKVKGDVSATTLAIADGSFFQGQVHMKEPGKPPQQVKFQEKRRI